MIDRFHVYSLKSVICTVNLRVFAGRSSMLETFAQQMVVLSLNLFEASMTEAGIAVKKRTRKGVGHRISCKYHFGIRLQ